MGDQGEHSDRGDEAWPDVAARKRDHLALALGADVGFASLTTGLERVRLRARALPERDLADVDLGLDVWGRALNAPLLVSCMTGGVSEAGPVNRALAEAAQSHRVALGLGSGRVLLEGADPRSFQVRDVAPDVLILANLGAVQLHVHDADDCARLVELCGADALVLHLNAVQEAVQSAGGRGEGETSFGGLCRQVARLCRTLAVPVVVKEVGFGMAPEDVMALAEAGVAAVDVAGAGGTNWARLEGLRASAAGAVADAFADWGWTTVESLRSARATLDAMGSDTWLIGSGGLRHGVDALKVLCLGARLAGLARGLLAAGAAGPEQAATAVGTLVAQLRIAAWAVGAGKVEELGPHLLHR